MATRAAVSEVRAWAKTNGFDIGDRGRLPTEVWVAWSAAATPSKRASSPVPADPAPAPPIDQAELREARERIARLEAELEQLTGRLAAIEKKAHAELQPRRRFARR